MGFVNRTTNTISRVIGTDSGTAGTAKAVSDLGSSVGQALSDFDKTVGISAVSREATQFANDIGLTAATKEVSDVVHNIGKAAEKDPLQYAAIVACIAAAPFTGGTSLQFIPYIQATAKVTSKNTSIEDMIQEGAKAYLISQASGAVGDYVTGDPVTGDITGGTVPATGATGATGSVAVGKAAGNISANIVANAARGGKATVADIIASGVSDAGLQYLAEAYTPNFGSLTKKEQAAAINGVKLVLGDKSAASSLVNDALRTSIAAASKAAFAEGYDNPWQRQTAKEAGFTDSKTFKAADKLGIDTNDRYQDYQKVSEAFEKEGYNATQDQIKEYISDRDKSYAVDEIRAKYDPLATTSDEAAEFFRTQGYTPTPEELRQYVGNKAEAEASRDITAYADPLATMADEATEFFQKEGYTPTPEELQQYVGNKAETEASRDISAYADPRAVIEEEARAQYLAQGIPDPTREELDKYIQQRTEADVLGELDVFADPQGTTAQEARAFAAKYNLNPDSIDNLAQLTSTRTSELGSQESLSEYRNAIRSTDPEYYSAQDRAYKYALSRGQSDEEARSFAEGYAKTTLGRDVEVGDKPTFTRSIDQATFGGQPGSEDYYAAPGTRLATVEEVMADQASGAGKTYYDPNVDAWVTGIAPDIGDLGLKSTVTTKELTDYQSGDGSIRIPNPDGSYHMYSPQGVYMGVYTGNDAFVSYEPELSPFDVKPDFAGYPIQDFGGGEAENMDSFNDAMKSAIEERGGFPVGSQQVGTDRVYVYDDGTGIGMNENGDPYALSSEEITRMVDNGLLNTAASGYEFGSDADPKSDPWYKNVPWSKIPIPRVPASKPPSSPRDPAPKSSTSGSDPVSPSPLSASSALKTEGEKTQGSTLGKMPGSWVGGLGRPATFIDPLSATEPTLPGQEDSEDMYSTSPLAAVAAPRREEEMSLQPEVNYYSYGYEPSYSSIIQPYKNPSTMYAKGGEVMNSPLMAAQGGDVPHKGSHYVQGAGGGQDDLIDAKLADGEYVLDAEIVASLGDGSNKRGAEILDKWRKNIRKHKRSASIDGIPPKAKSPLEYMKGIK
jgi:hypothetical protein